MGVPALALAAQAGSSVMGGLAANAQGKAVAEQNDVNAFIGRTRAIQTDGSARENLNAELGSLRTAFAASGQRPTVGTETIFNELRRVRGRDRRIEYGNRMQEAASYKMAAKNARADGKAGLIGGFIGAAPSVFDIYKLKSKGY